MCVVLHISCLLFILYRIFFSSYSEYDIDIVPFSCLTNQVLLSSIKSSLLKFRIKLRIDEWVFLVEESFSLKYLWEMICGKWFAVNICVFIWGLIADLDYPKGRFLWSFIQESPYVSVLAEGNKWHISSILVK